MHGHAFAVAAPRGVEYTLEVPSRKPGGGVVFDGLLGGLADELVEGVHVAAGALMEFFLESQQGVGLVVVELEVVVVALRHGAPSLLLPLM